VPGTRKVTVTCSPCSSARVILAQARRQGYCSKGKQGVDSGVGRLIERFPEYAASIQDRFHDDESFRDMCSDYAETLEALQRWEASSGPHKAARIEEYQELARALESEVLTALGFPPRVRKMTRHDPS
jgi:hypothetical protein